MRLLQTPADFLGLIGEPLGVSDWIEIDQARIDAFAACTGDDFWIHVDTERAAREMPDGRTIAHGLLLLSMVPMLQRQIFHVERRGIGLNYGSDRVRYTAPVPVGSRVRLAQTLKSAEPKGGKTRIVTECTLQIAGSHRPAFVGDLILLLQDPQLA